MWICDYYYFVLTKTDLYFLESTDLHSYVFFLELNSATQTLTTCTYTHPYEHTYANPTPMSTFKGLRTRQDSRSSINASLLTGTPLIT
jgi:hypothetical protein